MISLDAAASEWKGNAPGEYYLPKSGKRYTTDDTSCGFIILVTLTVYHTHGQITTTYFAFVLKFC